MRLLHVLAAARSRDVPSRSYQMDRGEQGLGCSASFALEVGGT